MSENRYLQMPKPHLPNMQKKSLGLFCLFFALIVLAFAGILRWLANGKITSVYAEVESVKSHLVTSTLAGRLAGLNIKTGEHVNVGQVLGSIEANTSGRSQNDTNSLLMTFSPPDREEINNRIKSAEIAEKEITERINLKRQEEENKRKYFEACVMEHVQAQLQLRALEHQHGSSLYQRAVKREAEASEKMNKAKDDFEMFSRARAAMSQEMDRIHSEVLEAKRLLSRNRYNVRYAENKNQQHVENLLAPVSGLVQQINVSQGQTLRQGDPVLSITPEIGAKVISSLTAYFPLSAQDKIKKGQDCSLVRVVDGNSFECTVSYISLPKPLPSNKQQADAGTFLPVEITLNRASSVLKPEDLLSCTVQTRSLLGFGGL